MKDVITIDFTGVASYWEVHSILINSLELPSYYGRNLDALYDCLSEVGCEDEPVKVKLTGMDAADEKMGKYMIAIKRVFDDASHNNPWLKIEN